MDIYTEPGLYGAKFLRLCERLPLYDGAIRRRFELELQEQNQESGGLSFNSETTESSGQTMSMEAALASSKGDDTAVLHALNKEGANSPFGPLFEYETA